MSSFAMQQQIFFFFSWQATCKCKPSFCLRGISNLRGAYGAAVMQADFWASPLLLLVFYSPFWPTFPDSRLELKNPCIRLFCVLSMHEETALFLIFWVSHQCYKLCPLPQTRLVTPFYALVPFLCFCLRELELFILTLVFFSLPHCKSLTSKYFSSCIPRKNFETTR